MPRKDIGEPDWFYDPLTGIRAPQTAYCFRIDHRREDLTGNVKQVWELSRQHHLTVLATAFALSEDDAYAEAVGRQLRSWWAENPFLSGINWTSGIEIGLRLVAWVWIRRLLDGWPSVTDLFEYNPTWRLRQIWWHQRYLAAFRSRGSSANNHVIAEAAGQLMAALAFPWFEQSARWESEAAGLLQQELANNTYPSGVNRELASDYHGFVAELGLVAALEADRAGRPLADAAWRAARPDARRRSGHAGRASSAAPPERRGRRARLDARAGRRSTAGRPSWRWGGNCSGRPTGGLDAIPDATSVLLASMAPGDPPCPSDGSSYRATGPLRRRRPDHSAHAVGLRLGDLVPVRRRPARLPVDCGSRPCRRAGRRGPSRRRGRVGRSRDLLLSRRAPVAGLLPVDPRAQHDRAGRTGSVDCRAARSCGPVTPVTRVIESSTAAGADVWTWSAEHDGYSDLDPPAHHRRTVRLYRTDRQIEILDRVDSAGVIAYRLAFHLGPDVDVRLDGNMARLSWPGSSGEPATGELSLPASADWSLNAWIFRPRPRLVLACVR